MSALNAYPSYKPAGIPWLQQVPEHWEVIRMGALLQERGETNEGQKEQHVLSLLRKRGVIPYDEKGRIGNKKSEDITRYKIVRPDDIVVNSMNVIIGSVGISKYTGCLSPVYYVLKTRSNRDDAFYLNYVFQIEQFQKSLIGIGNGILAHRMRIAMEKFKCELFPRPPIEEQYLIVRYLHALDAKVKRYIRTKRKLIAALQEQKQAIIQRAVTRGLDPKVKLKHSGVEWLGEVPEHWEVLRCRFLFKEIDKRSVDGKETHLSMSQTLGLVPSDQVENRTLVSESYAGGKLCETNDLVLNRLKAHLGVFALAPQEGVISPDYSVFRGKRPMVMRYFEQVLRSPDCRHELRIRAKGIVEGFWRLYTDDFNDIFLPVPPVDEQSAILSAMDEELKGVHEAIRRIENEIALMQEYHTRLIADVVTGAVDVRAAAKAMASEGGEVLEEEPLSMAAEGEAEYGAEE